MTFFSNSLVKNFLFLFKLSSLCAISIALFSLDSFSKFTPNSLFPILPPAFIRGPKENPRA